MKSLIPAFLITLTFTVPAIKGFRHASIAQTASVVPSPSLMPVKIAQRNPDAEAFFQQAEQKYQSGDLNGAIADLNQAIRISPNWALAYYNRGLTRNALGDKQSAIADYTQAIQLNPNYAGAYNNRGNARADLGDKQGAMADYSRAIQLNSNFTEAYRNRGNARISLGDRQGAISDLQQAANLYQAKGDTANYNKMLTVVQELKGQ